MLVRQSVSLGGRKASYTSKNVNYAIQVKDKEDKHYNKGLISLTILSKSLQLTPGNTTLTRCQFKRKCDRQLSPGRNTSTFEQPLQDLTLRVPRHTAAAQHALIIPFLPAISTLSIFLYGFL